MKKKMLVILTMLCLMYSFAVNATDRDISVYIDNQKISFDVAPIMINDRTMVPMRKIFETLGAKIMWLEDEQVIAAKTDAAIITMQIGNQIFSVYDIESNETKTFEFDVVPQIINDRTLIPARAVAETLGCTVDWDESRYRVLINTKELAYYPESPLLPTYGSLGYYVSTLSRDENEILHLENGGKAYIIGGFDPNESAQGYIARLINEFGWEKIFSKSGNKTGYNVLEKEKYLVGIAVYYSGDSWDYIRIYPELDEEHIESEPVFYNEYPDLPMFSVVMSLQCRYAFDTPDNNVGFAYDSKYTGSYGDAIEAYGWKQTNYFGGFGGYAYTYEKEGQKICVADLGDGVYVFGYSGEMDSEEAVKQVVNYGKEHQREEMQFPQAEKTDIFDILW